MHHLSTLMAVDDGANVWLFPASVIRSAGEIRSTAAYMKRLDRLDFVRAWINAYDAPLPGEPETRWREDSRARTTRNSEDREVREQLARARALREQQQSEVVCEYQGPRSNLI